MLSAVNNETSQKIFAFEHGNSGDLFVNKAPSGTIGDLAQALKEIFNSEASVKIIGTRHGEKLYESLISREEMARAIDLKEHYMIPADNRDLNYNKYFTEGSRSISEIDDYHSHNTKRLSESELIFLLKMFAKWVFPHPDGPKMFIYLLDHLGQLSINL